MTLNIRNTKEVNTWERKYLWLIVRQSLMKAGWRDDPLVLQDLAKAIPIISGDGLPLLTENIFKTPHPFIWTLAPLHLLIFTLSAEHPLLLRYPPPTYCRFSYTGTWGTSQSICRDKKLLLPYLLWKHGYRPKK